MPMPRSSSEQFFDAVVELRKLETKHSKEHQVAVQYYNKLLKEIDDSATTYDWEKEESSLPKLLETIHALKQDVFNGKDLPCFASKAVNKEPSPSYLLANHGQFANEERTVKAGEEQPKPTSVIHV